MSDPNENNNNVNLNKDEVTNKPSQPHSQQQSNKFELTQTNKEEDLINKFNQVNINQNENNLKNNNDELLLKMKLQLNEDPILKLASQISSSSLLNNFNPLSAEQMLLANLAKAAQQQQQQPTASLEALNSMHQSILQQKQLANSSNDLISSLQATQAVQNQDPKLGSVSMDHPDAERWFYLDPQNQIQGSFSSEQMAGWFAAGYFPLNLMIKRGCDEKFLPLGVVTNNWGRIPFTSGPQPQSQVNNSTKSQPQQSQQPQQPSKEHLLQQMQLFQQMQHLQFFPQNFNNLRSELAHQANNNMNIGSINAMMQQLLQLQLQQKNLAASVGSLGPIAVQNLMQELRSQQESLINQFSLANNQNSNNNVNNQKNPNDPAIIDPAILGASNKSQSIWGDVPGNFISIFKQ